jgi:hypothetical protein
MQRGAVPVTLRATIGAFVKQDLDYLVVSPC